MKEATSYLVIDGFDFAGNMLVQDCLLSQGDRSGNSHHIMVLNNHVHDAGGCGIGFGSGDYYTAAGNVVWNTSSRSPYHESGIGVYQPIALPGFTSLPWDKQRFHIQFLENIAHDNSEGPAVSGHTDGNGIIMDNFHGTQWSGGPGNYPYESLVASNLSYSNGGRGVYAMESDHITFANNTTYGNGTDLGGAGELVELCATDNTWINNVGYAKNNTALVWQSAWCGGWNSTSRWSHNQTFNGTPGQQSISIDSKNLAMLMGNGNLLGVDPKLTNVGAQNFTPLSTSPVLGAGVAGPAGYPLMTVDGNLQPSPPNIGALATGGPPPPPPSIVGPVSINAGGTATGSFVVDAGFSGGQTISNWTGAVNTSLVASPAPQAVYQSERYGTFSYRVSKLKPAATYMVNLHFTEDWDTAPGQRLQNVSINGAQVLANFDIFAAAGAQHKAIMKTFTANADATGDIVISFAPAPGSADGYAKVDGLQVLAMSSSATATIAANPTSVRRHSPITVTWSSTEATSCTGVKFSTGGAQFGSKVLYPVTTTTYSINCMGPNGPANASVMVEVT